MTTEMLGVNGGTAEADRWIPDDSTFGARLALIRQKLGWGNVAKAAEACGLPVESWRTWERDNVEPRGYESICRRIAVRTGCDIDWLLRGRDGHKFGSVRAATRPVDNRPSGRPRVGDERANTRRPRRLRAPTSGVPSRNAA